MPNGFRESDMYPYVRSALRRRYPASEGWYFEKTSEFEHYIPDFILRRDVGPKKQPRIERVVVEVKAVSKATKKHISQLNGYVRNLAGGKSSIWAKHLVYPAGADTSLVKDDIDVFKLRVFACE